MKEKAENPDLDPEFTPIEAIEQDKRGTLMKERESWERVIDGLKLASDGARNMARFARPDVWNRFAMYLDQIRRAMAQEAGFNRAQDTIDSAAVVGDSSLSWAAASARVFVGLKDAAAGARQISLGQRMDIRWTNYANQIDKLRLKAHEQAMEASPLKVKSSWGGGPARMQ